MTLFLYLFKFIINFFYLFFKLFKTRKEITLISRQSNSITEDYQLLSEQLRKDLKDYEVIVLCKKMDNKIAYCFHMFKQMYHIATSQLVILDSYSILISNLKHKQDLQVIQIWHALGLMKKAGVSIVGKEEGRKENISKLLNMHKNYNYIFTTSEACIPSMAEVFGYDPKFVSSVPLPRIDYLKDRKYVEECKKKVYQKYPTLKKKKNVLYAPTFRKEESLLQENLNELIQNFNYDKYNLIIKLHPLSKIMVSEERVFSPREFSTLEMIMVSDYVISDYSSIIYEAGILHKNQLFFAFDLDKYKNKRDFFIDYTKEVPGPIFKIKPMNILIFMVMKLFLI